MKLVVVCTAMLAATIAMANATSAKPTKTLSPSDQALYKAGMSLYKDKCSGCHSDDLKGVSGLGPSLLPDGPMKHYDQATFTTLMQKNIGYDGKKMSLPMAGKVTPKQIDQLWVFLKNH